MENDALATLHEWSADNRVSHTLLTVLYSNTTEIRAGLNKLASTQFSADARFQLGPDGLTELYAYMSGIKTDTRDVQRSITGVKVIKRDHNRQ